MQQKPFRKKLFWHAGIKTMLSNAAAIHYASNGEQELVEGSLGLKHGVVIPLGAEIETSDKSVTEDPFIERFPALKDRPYVLVLSRLLETKGLDVLLDAFLSLAKRSEFQQWRLVFAGKGPAGYVASLERTASQQGASALVVFTGWLDGAIKKSALRNAALLALPSYHENFGLCVMEALACRVPVLVSPQVNLANEIDSAGAGWITPIEKKAIESALEHAFSCPEERLKRGRAGKNLAQMYSWARVATQLQDLYSSILVPTSA
jgi:glycosyltransferase involved in cell wall biosynthesis